jgi:hypothetical protein
LDVYIVTYLVPLFSTTHPRFGEFPQIWDLSHFLNNTSSPKLFLLFTETVTNALSFTSLGYILGKFSGPKVCTVFFSQKNIGRSDRLHITSTDYRTEVGGLYQNQFHDLESETKKKVSEDYLLAEPISFQRHEINIYADESADGWATFISKLIINCFAP